VLRSYGVGLNVRGSLTSTVPLMIDRVEGLGHTSSWARMPRRSSHRRANLLRAAHRLSLGGHAAEHVMPIPSPRSAFRGRALTFVEDFGEQFDRVHRRFLDFDGPDQEIADLDT